MKAFGTRPTYQIFSVAALVTGLIYLLFNILYLSKRPQPEGNDIVKKIPKKPVDQNGLENGTAEQINLDGRIEEKEKIARGIENEAFVKDREEDIEVINNAKNLDKIEKMPEDDPKEKKRKRTKNERRESIEEKPMSESNGRNEVRQRHPQKGTDHPGFEIDDRCDVTVEREPDDKK